MYHNQIRTQTLNPTARTASSLRIEDAFVALIMASVTRLNGAEIPQPRATPAGRLFHEIARMRVSTTKATTTRLKEVLR